MQPPPRKSLTAAGILCLAALFLAAQARAGDDKPWRHGKKLGDFSAESAGSSEAAAPAQAEARGPGTDSKSFESEAKEADPKPGASEKKPGDAKEDEYSWRHGKKLEGSASEDDRSWRKGKTLGEFKDESKGAAASTTDSKAPASGDCPLSPKEQQGAAFVQALQKALADKNEAEVAKLLSCGVPLSAEDEAQAKAILDQMGAASGSPEIPSP